jgi:hypothetical protein
VKRIFNKSLSEHPDKELDKPVRALWIANRGLRLVFYSLKHAGLKPCNFIARIYYAFFSLSEKNNQANFIRVPIFKPLHFQCRVV